MDFELDELKREFLAEARNKLTEMDEVLGNGGDAGRESFERIGYLAHQLKGAGGSYGFATISTEAAALEKEVELIEREEAASTDSLKERVRHLKIVIEQSARELQPLEA